MGKKTNILAGLGIIGIIGVAARHLIKNDDDYKKVKDTADNIYNKSKDFADNVRDKFKDNTNKESTVVEETVEDTPANENPQS